jgi:tetratricopeptide (TPR) repeat protein
MILGGAAALAMLAIPNVVVAQECIGEKPRGGRWVTSAELYITMARRQANPQTAKERWQQALGALEEGMVEQSDNPKNFALAGQAYAELGRYKEANAAFTQAESMWSCYDATMDTLRYVAWTKAWNLGVRYIQAGDEDQAVENFNNAWLLYDKLPQPMIQLGNIYTDRALVAENEDEQVRYETLAVYSFRNALEAVATAPRISDAQRQEFSRASAFNLAQILAYRERFEEAAAAYDAYLAMEPGNVDAMSNAAVVLVRGSNLATDQAEEMEDGPEKEALLAKSDSLRAVALDHYDVLLAREDLTADEYHNIGNGLNRIRLGEQGVLAFRMALALEPYRINSLEQIARAYMNAEQYDSLAVVAALLVERYPLSLDNLALLANAYRELERRDETLAVLERREELAAELTDLELEMGEDGVYMVNGYIHNIKAEAESELVIEIDFMNNAGEVVATESVPIVVPAQDSQAQFSVSTESEAQITGFVYRPADAAQPQTDG